MSREILTGLAGSMLVVTLWLSSVVAVPGGQPWAAIGMGAAAYVTMLLVVAAARTDDRVRR